MQDVLLPVGTVVTFNKQNVLIIGKRHVLTQRLIGDMTQRQRLLFRLDYDGINNVAIDYVAVKYPDGYSSDNSLIYFNHTCIDHIFQPGEEIKQEDKSVSSEESVVKTRIPDKFSGGFLKGPIPKDNVYKASVNIQDSDETFLVHINKDMEIIRVEGYHCVPFDVNKISKISKCK